MCEYDATDQSNLTKHKKLIHEGGLHYCKGCEYVTSSEAYLRKHQKIKHIGDHAFKEEITEENKEGTCLEYFINFSKEITENRIWI